MRCRSERCDGAWGGYRANIILVMSKKTGFTLDVNAWIPACVAPIAARDSAAMICACDRSPVIADAVLGSVYCP
jgi:hypothetical protein